MVEEADFKCPNRANPSGVCWLNPVYLSLPGEQRLPLERIAGCYSCSAFIETQKRSRGRRQADKNFQTMFDSTLSCLDQFNEQLQEKIEELSLLKEVTENLIKTNDLQEALATILAGVTVGGAFGFNRAAVFLEDSKRGLLCGELAVGPKHPEEAKLIWKALEDQKPSLSQIAKGILSHLGEEKEGLSLLIRGVNIPLDQQDNILIRSLRERESFNLQTTQEMFSDFPPLEKYSGGAPCLVVPIVNEERGIGVLIADNSITGKHINAGDVVALETFANTAAPVLENISLRKRLETQLRELEQVHQLLQENQDYLIRHERLADIGKLATTVAHEVRTPLVTIGGYAQRLLRNFGSDRFEREDLEVIVEEIDRLDRITRELLEYSKESPLELESCDFNLLVSKSMEVLAPKLKDHNITLRLDYHPQELQGRLDRHRLRQVIFNLVENAIDSMSSGGDLTIATGRRDNYLSLEISDTGAGIPKEKLPKLFTPFFTTKSKGSGLGLPVSKKIIDAHGGFIDIATEVGKGSRFTIFLPMPE
jgi:signal transduction histidine kinase